MERRRKNPTKVKKEWLMREKDLFIEKEGCRLLIGNTEEECKMLDDYDDYLALICPRNLFMPFDICTVAAIGRFLEANIEGKYCNLLVEGKALDPHILYIEVIGKPRFLNPIYDHLDFLRFKKKKPTTKKNGGKSFRSQVTIATTNDVDAIGPAATFKIYKIKMFSNGTVHIPGIVHSDMNDIVTSLVAVRAFLQSALENENLKFDFLNAIMRNYKCGLRPPLAIKMGGLMNCVIAEQTFPMVPVELHKKAFLHFEKRMGNFAAFHIMRFMRWSVVPTRKPHHSDNKTVGILIKFARYGDDQPKRKDLTIRVVTSGKITFNGANSQNETKSSHLWLNYICTKYYREIVYDTQYDFVDISDDELRLELLYS